MILILVEDQQFLLIKIWVVVNRIITFFFSTKNNQYLEDEVSVFSENYFDPKIL